MQPIQIRLNRFSYLIPIPFVLFLMWVFYWYTIAHPNEYFTGIVKIFLVVTFFVEAVGLFLVGYFLKQFINPSVIFRMDDKGILYSPAGVSSGIISWSDIHDVNEVNIAEVIPNWQANDLALAIQLKDPDEFRKRFKLPVRKAQKISGKIYQADILLEKKYLKENYEVVKDEMKRRIPMSFLASPRIGSPLDII